MSARRNRVRRGQPLVVLVALLAGWTGLRMAMLAEAPRDEAAARPVTRPSLAGAPAMQDARPSAKLSAEAGAPVRAEPEGAPQIGRTESSGTGPLTILAKPADPRAGAIMPALPYGTGPTVFPTFAPPPERASTEAAVTPRIAAGHQLLFAAALAQLPMPAMLANGRPMRSPEPAPTGRSAARWSGDGWLLLRSGGGGLALPAGGTSGAYGASQAGAVVRYRLAPSNPHRPEAYVRATTALKAPRGEELAAGLAVRPLGGIPLAALVEARATRTLSGTVMRPAAALVSELPPASLPLGLRAEAYGQAGYVGGREATCFADGQVRIEKVLAGAGRWQLRAGAGAWGGAQKGASRVDVGPTATMDLPLGPVSGRLAADWRFRVGGTAAPASGPALTLSAGF